jgi:hypothetical protein
LSTIGDKDSLVSEAIEELEKAIDLKPDHDDAMTYLGLMYREKVDLELHEAARASDLKAADQLVQRALEAKNGGAKQPFDERFTVHALI